MCLVPRRSADTIHPTHMVMARVTGGAVLAVALIFLLVSTTHPVEYKQNEITFHISNWTLPGIKHYALGLSLQTDWIKAYQLCRYHGMRLATIDSEEDEIRLGNTVNSSGHKIDYLWTSATDASSEGYFYWMSTGKPLTYTRWAGGQPDNHNSQDNCVYVDVTCPEELSWWDADCSRRLFPLCEYFTHSDSIDAYCTKTPVLV